MDTAKTFDFRLIARVVREKDQERITAGHGFTPVVGQEPLFTKVSHATFLDSMMYAQTLRGIPGVVQVQMMPETDETRQIWGTDGD